MASKGYGGDEDLLSFYTVFLKGYKPRFHCENPVISSSDMFDGKMKGV